MAETETETETENDNSRADVDDENEELWAPPEDCTDEELALGRPITPGRREELRARVAATSWPTPAATR